MKYNDFVTFFDINMYFIFIFFSHFLYIAHVTVDFHFRSVFAKESKGNDFKWYELDADCSQNTNSESRSAFRMVKLLSLGGTTYR
jgi:hypothetical protein